MTLYIGKYTHWKEDFDRVENKLTLYFYPLQVNEAKERIQFSEVRTMCNVLSIG
ncbi:MAG: hypothetical protein ACMUEM_06085 [Flavobacteriales bacterium AspAUS03]